MDRWFTKQSRLVQILLLLIPGVNWVVEVLVRWSSFARKPGALKLVISIVVTVFGLAYAWIDMICCLITKHLLFQ